MDERISFDDEPTEPSGSPLGLLVAVGAVALALAIIALRPADVSPNSLSASPPTSLLVPPEALTTTTTAANRADGLSLSDQVPGLRGAIHLEVSTASSGRDDQGRSGQLWIWNAAFSDPIRADVPGSVDISANRRHALAISWNQADEGVLWLGPKADVRPAHILPGLTQATWSRDVTRNLVTAQVSNDTTTFTIWGFSGADSQVSGTLTVEGRWHLVHFSGNLIGVTSEGTTPSQSRARMIDWIRQETTLDVPGFMASATSGPPVIARCMDSSCTDVSFSWVEEGVLIPAPGHAWPIPSTNGPYVAAFDWQDATSRTVIYDRAGDALMEVPSHGFVGAWSGDGRFFVYPRAEAGFGDRPALVFVDTFEQRYHEVTVPSADDWFVTRIWYGP